jgi:glycosyltransferase involved in cell wall biosynthesis
MLEGRPRYARLLKYFLLTIFWTLPLALYHGVRYRRHPATPDGDGPFGIVCISHVPWSSAWQRNHHTMYDLSKRHKVLYCHPVVVCGDRLDFLSADGSRRRDGHGNPDLVVIEPLIIRGERVLPLVRAINKIILVATIKKTMARMNMGPRILWFYSPLNEYLAGSLDELLTVYDIQDEYAGFLGTPEHVRETENRLLGKADLVFTGTYALYEDKRKYNQNIHFVPCGVDAAHFKNARIGNPSLPEDIKRVEHPIVGYFGRVCGRMDTELLAWMADSHPEWSIVLIGEVIEQEFPLEERPNILLLGQKSYADLPQYVHAFDVCMIPFRLNELTLKVNPTKLLEYMAAGKPVVSTAIPDMVRFYGNVIDIARNKEEFIAAVESTLQANRAGASEAVIRGMAIAEGSDWTATIAKMESFMRTDMERKHSVR